MKSSPVVAGGALKMSLHLAQQIYYSSLVSPQAHREAVSSFWCFAQPFSRLLLGVCEVFHVCWLSFKSQDEKRPNTNLESLVLDLLFTNDH